MSSGDFQRFASCCVRGKRLEEVSRDLTTHNGLVEQSPTIREKILNRAQEMQSQKLKGRAKCDKGSVP